MDLAAAVGHAASLLSWVRPWPADRTAVSTAHLLHFSTDCRLAYGVSVKLCRQPSAGCLPAEWITAAAMLPHRRRPPT
jgi:hypothetical protein